MWQKHCRSDALTSVWHQEAHNVNLPNLGDGNFDPLVSLVESALFPFVNNKLREMLEDVEYLFLFQL